MTGLFDKIKKRAGFREKADAKSAEVEVKPVNDKEVKPKSCRDAKPLRQAQENRKRKFLITRIAF